MEDGMLNRVTFIPGGRCSPSGLESRWPSSPSAKTSEASHQPQSPLGHPSQLLMHPTAWKEEFSEVRLVPCASRDFFTILM
jgi:hypothetical protein